jgi:hypothetical protein
MKYMEYSNWERARLEIAQRTRIGRIIQAITPAMNKADIQGLIKMGCPDDEYDWEIRDIAVEIDRHTGVMGGMMFPDVNGIAHIIANVDHRWFGLSSNPAQYDNPVYTKAAELVSQALLELVVTA